MVFSSAEPNSIQARWRARCNASAGCRRGSSVSSRYSQITADSKIAWPSTSSTGERLGVDASTVFRSVQRMEKGLGQRLFERSRAGYQPAELAQVLAAHAEQMEAQLESARSAVQSRPSQVTGTVRITTTDTLL